MAPCDSGIYTRVRIFFSIVVLLNLVELWPNRLAFFSDSGMIHFATDAGHSGVRNFSLFNYLGSDSAVTGSFLVAAVAMILLGCGLCTRVSAILVYVWQLSYVNSAPLVVHGWDALLTNISFILLFSPLGDQWNARELTGRLRVRKKVRKSGMQSIPAMVPRYGILLLRLQFVVIYWQTAWLKLQNPDWINGTFISHFMNSIYSRFPAPEWYEWTSLSMTLTYATLLIEFSLPILCLCRATRVFGIMLGVAFHVGIAACSTLWLFSLSILVLYVAFIETKQSAHRITDIRLGAYQI